jgi:hypothetical protein
MSDTGPSLSNGKWNDTGHFVEYENEYFHAYLESIPECRPYFLSSVPKKRLESLQDHTLSSLLQEIKEEKFSNLLPVLDHWSFMAREEGWHIFSDNLFSQTIKLLSKYASRLSAEEFIESMAKLNSLGFRQSVLSLSEPRKSRILVSKAFDIVCCKRLKTFDVKELLLAADFFYSVRGSSFTDFPLVMCERMRHFLPSLTKHELLVVLFHAGLTRRTSSKLIEAVMEHLKPHMATLSLQELGIINLAHFKTRSYIQHPSYFTSLTKQLKTEAGHDLDPICLSAVLKYQQIKSMHSRRVQQVNVPQFYRTIQDLEDPLLPRIPTLTSETLMHVLNLYHSLDLLSEDMYMAVVDRVLNKGVSDWR